MRPRASVPSTTFDGKRRDLTLAGAREVDEYLKTLETIAREGKSAASTRFANAIFLFSLLSRDSGLFGRNSQREQTIV
jgi:hypothetical protein